MALTLVPSPFLDIKSFTTDPSGQQNPPAPAAVPRSPFLAVYETDEYGAALAPAVHDQATLAAELHEDELDEAIFEAVTEAAEIYDRSGAGRDGALLVRQHFSTLQREVEQMFDAAAERFARAELNSLNQNEAAEFFDGYSPRQEMSPAFENLFGGILKAVKNVAGKAIDLAKSGALALGSAALGPLLNKLKPLALKLLNHVLRVAIERLPEALRPVARQLAKRFGLAGEVEETGSGFGEVQREFNEQMAEALLAPGEVERDLEVARAVADTSAPARDALGDLNRAREELSDRLSRLKEGEDPGPALENFIPALLPVLKVGIKLAGRSRLVGFLARFLSPLLRRFTGNYAEPLSKAIVDAGLRVISLEATPENAARAANSAVISAVEDTVRRVAALPEYMLDDQELLEGAALEAFEQAAAANFPPVLGEDTYRVRPDLRESAQVRGTWVALPLCGVPRYKKFSRVVRARITPEKAGGVETFGGATLAEFLEEQLGLAPGSELEADVHLYESMPGTLLPEVARLETGTPGLGSAAEAAYGQLHPLTPQAAAMLLGEPGLGRPMPPESLAARYEIQPGQRFYHLSMPGVRPPATSRGPGRLRRHSSLKVVLDFKAAQIRVRLYLAENRAQALLLRLRQQGHVGAILAWLRPMVERKLESALLPRAHGGVAVIHPNVAPQHASGAALRHLPASLSGVLRFHLLQWILQGLREFLKNQTPQVLAAIESPQDGISFRITFHDPPGLALLRDALSGRVTLPGAATLPPGVPRMDVTVAAGHVHA